MTVRRVALPLLLALALVVACAPAAAPPPAAPAVAPGAPGAPAAPAAPAAPQPKKGGVLVFSASQPPDSIMPYKGGSIGEYIVFNGVYEGLVGWKLAPDLEVNEDYRSTYTIIPALADKWQVAADNRTHTFTMRQGAKWHDGQPVTVDDVLFSYGLLMDKANAYRGGTNLRDVESMEKVGADQLKIVLKAPAAEFLAGIGASNSAMFILPRHRADSLAAKEVVGSGPFKVKAMDFQSKAVYVRNDEYKAPGGGPYMDGAELVFGLDRSGQLAAIAARKIDFHVVGDKKQMEPILKAAPDLKTFTFFQTNGNHLYFRLDKKPFDDYRVRKAMDLAIDRQALVQALYFGEGVINPPAGSGHKKGWGIPQEELLKLPGYRQPKDADIAEAKRLLAEAGYADGLKTSIMTAIGRTSTPPIAEAIAGQFRAVGIDMTIQAADRAAYNKKEKDGDFEINAALAAGDLPDERMFAFFYSKGNTSFVNDPQLDALVERQSRTLDVAQRGRLHGEIQKLVYDKAYALGTVDPASFVLVQPWVHNITINRGAQPYPMDWSPIWLDADKIPQR